MEANRFYDIFDIVFEAGIPRHMWNISSCFLFMQLREFLEGNSIQSKKYRKEDEKPLGVSF